MEFSQNQTQAIRANNFDSVNGFLSLGSKLERKIDKLRSKINEDEMSFDDNSSVEVYDGSNLLEKNRV